MPGFILLDEDEVDSIVSKGGVSKSTCKAREQVELHLTQFMSKRDSSADFNALVQQAESGNVLPLETLLMDFFASFRVTGDFGSLELPKRGTLDVWKSHIKVLIMQISDGKVDITVNSVFKINCDQFII
jgi:hypothetical protein